MTTKALGISRKCWYLWLKEHPDFAEAIEEAKEALIDRAETQIYKNILQGKETSLLFFLMNRAGDRWKDKRNLDLSGRVSVISCEEIANKWTQVLGITQTATVSVPLIPSSTGIS